MMERMRVKRKQLITCEDTKTESNFKEDSAAILSQQSQSSAKDQNLEGFKIINDGMSMAIISLNTGMKDAMVSAAREIRESAAAAA